MHHCQNVIYWILVYLHVCALDYGEGLSGGEVEVEGSGGVIDDFEQQGKSRSLIILKPY